MKTLKEIQEILIKHENQIKNGFKVQEIGIFGSYSKNEQSNSSDVDVLVLFQKDGKSFDNFMDLKFYLEELLEEKIDLVLKNALREEIKDEILEDTIYF
ncbi:MAG: nucleotidyltransferase [Calditrichaeota bacterium]|nr:MAG: nucleotidyltransferase [Calditrichota bacterium]